MNWTPGRQGTGYFKRKIVESRNRWIPFDVYVLKFPTGSQIPEHTDPIAPGLKHYRLNILLNRKGYTGGEFKCYDPIMVSSWFNFFRPDISPHRVTPVLSGARYVLSIGFAVKE